jgi:cation-transporting P-type ATPase I
VALLSDVASALLGHARRAGAITPGPGDLLNGLRPGRRACIRAGRAIIAAHPAPGLDDRLAKALEDVPGVRWARLNAPLQRVIVGLAADAPPLAALTAVVDRTEREYQAEQGEAGPDGRTARRLAADSAGESPVDRATVDRAVLAMAFTGTGLAMSAASRALRLVRMPAELAAVSTLIDSQPRLRGTLEAMIGRPATDLGLAATSGLGQGLAGGGAGLTVDLAHRVARLGEVLAAHDAWCAREPELLACPERAAAPVVATERPAPMPPGPVETYADQSGLSGLVTFGLAAAATGATRRALDLALAALPKAPRLGREGFACGLGRLLARRGAVVLDGAALRRLDRVNTVVLDAEVLVTGQLVLGDVIGLGDVRPEQVATHLHALFRAADATAIRCGNGWALGPVDRLPLRGRRGVRARQRLLRDGAAGVLGLARGQRLMAVAALTEEQLEATDTLAAACHHANVRLVVAGPRQWTSLADATVPGGERLPDSVRDLQAAGAVVLLVSRCRDALGRADVGIGIEDADGVPPWGADIMAGADLETAAVVIGSCGTAAQVSRQAVAFAQAGSVLGGIGSLTRRDAARSAMLGVNAAAALAFAQGRWAARQQGRMPLVPPVSRVPWHVMPADAVLARLNASDTGLSSAEAARRRRSSGLDADKPSLARAIAGELDNPLTPILAGGAALSAVVGSAVDAGLVAAVSALSAVVGGVQRLRAESAVAELMSGSAATARVVRDGREMTVLAEQLVLGDVIEVRSGEVVPADCRVLEAAGLQADESSVTGEAFPVTKQATSVLGASIAERASMLYEGTSIAAGRGRAVVVATGESTEAGRSMAATRGAAPPTGVETRLAAITGTTVPVALSSAGAVVAAGLLRGRPLRDSLGAAVSLAVGSVPEGLPFLVSAAQLASARRLSGHGALVRNPGTIEALGRVDTLCFDKTGTLTQGRITLAAVADAAAITPLDELGEEQWRTLAAGLRATPVSRHGRPLAQLTDQAVTEGAKITGVTRRHKLPAWRRLATLPFEPSRGFHASLGGAGDKILLSVKGAPENGAPPVRKGLLGQQGTAARPRSARSAETPGGAARRTGLPRPCRRPACRLPAPAAR